MRRKARVSSWGYERDEAGNALYNPLSAVAGGAADSHRVGCRVQPDAADAAGFWDVEMRSASAANRGYALVASSARRIDLSTGSLYDIELMPRIASVTPTSVSRPTPRPRGQVLPGQGLHFQHRARGLQHGGQAL